MYGSAEYWRCLGGQQAGELLALERPGNTQKQYDRWVMLWMQWNQLTHMEHLEADVHKFRLFAGWLLTQSRDKDLNKVRSIVCAPQACTTMVGAYQ